MVYSQEKIIFGLKNKESAIIKLIYKDIFPSIRNFILRNNGDDNSARDVFQEAIIILYNNLLSNNFKLDCTVKTYLYAVSKRIWLNELRKNHGKTTFIDEHEDTVIFNDNDFEVYNIKKLQLKIMQKCIEIMGDPCRKILQKFYVSKLNMQEIAEEMGYTNKENAKNQKYKCLQRLKKLFFKEFSKYKDYAYTR
ncbi:MAG: hypothetical protein Kow0068_06750 [Marinilabiliales bacterium]